MGLVLKAILYSIQQSAELNLLKKRFSVNYYLKKMYMFAQPGQYLQTEIKFLLYVCSVFEFNKPKLTNCFFIVL